MKCVDGLANTYLALAAIFTAGVKGIQDAEPLIWKDCPVDPATLKPEEKKALRITERIPDSLDKALDSLEKDDVVMRALGDAAETYIKVKRGENERLGKMDKEERRNWLIDRY
jgi:glutamine synthetase